MHSAVFVILLLNHFHAQMKQFVSQRNLLELIIQDGDVHLDKNRKRVEPSTCNAKITTAWLRFCWDSGIIARGSTWENRTLITVMNLSGEVLRGWHSCGLSSSLFWLPAPWSFIISPTIQWVVEGLIRNMEKEWSPRTRGQEFLFNEGISVVYDNRS